MDKYFGFFKQLYELELPGSDEYDVYQGYYAQLYEVITARDNYDIPLLMEQAAMNRAGRILELGCGSGRVLMPLANAGYPVVGIDLSEDMLEIAKMKIGKLPDRKKRNVSIQQGNMINFQLDEQFPLVILAATSVCLLDSESELEQMLENIYLHLLDGGRFVFDILDTESFENSEFRQGKTEAFTINQSKSHKQFILLGEERIASTPEKALMNFYAEVLDEDKVYRFFGSTRKTYFSYDSVVSVIKRTKFKIVNIEKKIVAQERAYFFIIEK